MNRGISPYAAEWALYGKKTDDTDAGILACSNGVLSLRDFETVLSRYSPGTLNLLPQATMCSFTGGQERDYLAIAIHDRSNDERRDRRGREIVFTRYFCVPYDELAAGAVSYYAMYEGFRGFALQGNDRNPVEASLYPVPPALPADDHPALRVAALLLTGRPVCILGADGSPMEERLRFLDAVMSLLPYGMRSRLSASTWASSTHQHKFRLFFASTPREGDDHIVTWGRHDSSAIGHSYADDYLAWLRDERRRPMPQLAALTEPFGFGSKDIVRMLERAKVSAETTGVYASSGDAEIATADVGDLIAYCAAHVTDPQAFALYLRRLRSHLGQPPAGDERQHYRYLIRRHRLLRGDLPLDAQTRAELYDVVLRLVFGLPLTYPEYCEVEACAGNPQEQPLHPELLRLMYRNGLAPDDLCLFLIVLEGLGEADLRQFLQRNQVPPAKLVEATADPKLRPAHARTVCAVALRLLRRASEHPGFDQRAVAEALRRHGYLAPVLQARHHGEPDYQHRVLAEMLQIAYPARLDEAAIREILGNTGYEPTRALLIAVLQMVDEAGRDLAEKCFLQSLIYRNSAPGPAAPAMPRPPEPGAADGAAGADGSGKTVPDSRPTEPNTLARIFHRGARGNP